MTITITTRQILKILYFFSWILFVGICIEAGGFIFNAFFTLVINPIDAKYFWREVDLSSLYAYDHGHFFAETFAICIVAVLRAWLFYLIIKLLHDDKLNMTKPFSGEVARFISKMAYIALLIGLFSWWGMKYSEWLTKKGVIMPGIQYLRLAGADVWLFMSVTLYVIAQIFKRGTEIQSENDLTV
jgi:hypothetical protein